MIEILRVIGARLAGDPKVGAKEGCTKLAHRLGRRNKGPPQGVSLDSCAGPVHVEWDTEAVLTPLGQSPFFIDFLKAAGLFDAFVADCPLRYTSPNAPKKRDVLGTTMLSMLSGHKRYALIAGSVAIAFFQSFSA